MKMYTFARCDGLINQLLLRNVLTSYHEISTQGKLHTNTFGIPRSQGPQEGATLFHVVEQFDMILASHCQVMFGG